MDIHSRKNAPARHGIDRAGHCDTCQRPSAESRTAQADANGLSGTRGSDHRTDSDFAVAALEAIRWITTVPHDAVKATVRDGWLMLEGSVNGWPQKQAAEQAVRNVAGIKGVANLIMIAPKVTPAQLQARIASALGQNASPEARQIQAEIIGSRVVLRGQVRHPREKETAERAAWTSAGVTEVESDLRLANPNGAVQDTADNACVKNRN
jgi:osmotically-inducible protein OsmY